MIWFSLFAAQEPSPGGFSLSTWITIILGVAAIAVTATIYFVSARANREQARMKEGAVDAGAYKRAKEIYEGAISTLQNELDGLRAEMTRLRNANEQMTHEMESVRRLNREMQYEVDQLKRNNEQLSDQVIKMKSQLNVMGKPTTNS